MALARLTLLQSAALLNDSADTYSNEYRLALEQATYLAQKYCNRTLELTDYEDERYQGHGRGRLYPLQWPVVVDVSHDLVIEVWDGSSWVTLSSATYELRSQRFIEYPKLGQESAALYGAWPVSYSDNIRLTYSAGYDTTDWDTAALDDTFGVPQDLEMAVAMLAAQLWQQAMSTGVSAESFGPRSVTYRDGETISAEIRNMLDPYVAVAL